MGVSDLGGIHVPPYVWMPSPMCPNTPTQLYVLLCSKVSTVVNIVKLYGKFKSMKLLPGAATSMKGQVALI